jgi:hypothetical protein
MMLDLGRGLYSGDLSSAVRLPPHLGSQQHEITSLIGGDEGKFYVYVWHSEILIQIPQLFLD